MLLPDNIHPELTVYYNGALVIGELKKKKKQGFLELYRKLKDKHNMSVLMYVLCLDWLYIIDGAKVNDEGAVELCT